MDDIIQIMNKLQDVFSTVGTESIQLPQIVAIGGQSTGKSSVIESIVGRSFLPRGTGIVTRCPLILQLNQLSDDGSESESESDSDESTKSEDYAKFLHTGEKVFTDFDEIYKEIDARTDKLAGSNKGICHIPITLKIYSTKVPTLTLVDLPGMTKVPVGDQPENIEDQIKELVFKYIENPNSIILAVTAANTDIATSEALKFAKEVDPDGERTLAVLTKLDLMDAGTDAKDMLAGNVIPVKLGIIGVINRSQQDIIDKKGIPESLKKEAAYLQKKYPSFAATNGTPYLGKTLNRLLFNHIRNVLPDLNKRLRILIAEKKDLLNNYGEEVTDKGRVIIQIINKFASIYSASIEGNVANTEIGNCTGGAEIYCICFEIYKSEMESIDSLQDITDKEIWIASKSMLEPPMFISEEAFKSFVRKQIARFKKPSLECLDDVHEKMLEQIQNCLKKSLLLETDRFPKLASRFLNILTKYLSKCAAQTKEMIENMLDIELTYINTQHPEIQKTLYELEEEESEKESAEPTDFILSTGKAAQLVPIPRKIQKISQDFPQYNSDAPKITKNTIKDRMACHTLTEDEMKSVDKIKALITSYFNIVKDKLLDSVPKAVMHFLVFPGKDNIREELMTQMYVKEMLDDLLKESDQVSVKRKESAEMLKALNRASDILSEVADIHI